MKKEPLVFVGHINDVIIKIELFTKGVTKEEFMKNEMLQFAVFRGLEIIGETSKNVPLSFRKEHPSVPWRSTAGIRDKLIHHYFGVDLQIVWDIIKQDLPSLKKNVQKILKTKNHSA